MAQRRVEPDRAVWGEAPAVPGVSAAEAPVVPEASAVGAEGRVELAAEEERLEASRPERPRPRAEDSGRAALWCPGAARWAPVG